MDVETGDGVLAGGVGPHGDDVGGVERAQAPDVAERADVDVERVLTLTGEHGHAVADLVVGHARQPVVVRRGPRTHVRRRHREVPAEHATAAVADLGHRVGLAQVVVRVTE